MLADVVRERRSEVLECARGRLAVLMPERSVQQASDYLPSLLDQVVAALEGTREKADDDPVIASSAARHGRERQQLGVDIHSVVHDFGVICDGVAEVVRRAGAQIDGADWQKLNRALDLAIAEAITGYEVLRRAEERRQSAAALGSLAHELRNALAAASVAFEAVRRGRVGTSSRTADIVTRNLKRAALLSVNLVLESKLDAQPELALVSLALRPLVDDVVASLPGMGNLEFESEVPPELTLVGDKELVTAALTNLLQNAAKFTRPGGRITVRAQESEGAIAIEVEDECGGLPPEMAGRLFTPFAQGGADRSGAGLGLSIVRKIMVAHGGSAGVRDLPGRGCIFELSFPRRLPQ